MNGAGIWLSTGFENGRRRLFHLPWQSDENQEKQTNNQTKIRTQHREWNTQRHNYCNMRVCIAAVCAQISVSKYLHLLLPWT
jgi:hypothetical protein